MMWHFQKVIAFTIVTIFLALSFNAKADTDCALDMKCLSPIDANSKEAMVNSLIDQGFTREEIMHILADLKKDK